MMMIMMMMMLTEQTTWNNLLRHGMKDTINIDHRDIMCDNVTAFNWMRVSITSRQW